MSGFLSYRLFPPAGGSVSWRSEYRRIVEKTPCYLTDELRDHHHQVLHVSFSHDGRHFATCSKDGFVLVRNWRRYVVGCTEGGEEEGL